MPVADSATPDQVIAQLERLSKLTDGAEEIRYRGWSTCRLCGIHNGTYAFITALGEIPVGLKHYIVEHSVLVPGLMDDLVEDPGVNEDDI